MAWNSNPWTTVELSEGGGGGGGSGGVAFTVPRSDALTPTRQDAVVWARHGVIGGNLARSWGSYQHSGTRFTWSIRHGSGGNPVLDVDALSGSAHTFVVLTPGVNYTSAEVAEAIADQLLSAFSHTATVDTTTVDGQTRSRVRIATATPTTGLVGGAAGQSLTDMCGIQECMPDGEGPIAGTAYQHIEVACYDRDGNALPAGRRVRVTGVAFYGTADGIRPRLGVGIGGPYAAPPGAIVGIVDAGRPATGSVNSYDPIVLPLATAIQCVVGDDLWVLLTDSGAGGDMPYRLHASSGFFGNLSNTDQLQIEATRNDPATAYPGSVNPTITSTFSISTMVALVVEADSPANDGSGFAGNGSIYAEYGCRRDSVNGGPSTFTVNDETYHFRILTPEFSRVAVVGSANSHSVIDADDDQSAVVYGWPNLSNPPGADVVRYGVSGLLGFDTGIQDEYNEAIYPARIPIGSDVIAEPYVSVGYTGGQIAGGLGSLTIYYDPPDPAPGYGGEILFPTHNTNLRPSDFVVGGLRQLAEMRSIPTSTMPYNAPAGTWPALYDFAGTDFLQANLARTYNIIREQSATADVISVV